MKVVHLVLSNSFAGIEQHVNELLININNVDTILICNESIAKKFDSRISTIKIKNIGRRSFFGKYKLKKLLNSIEPDIVHTHGSKTTSIVKSINKNAYKHIATVHGIKKDIKVYESADFVIGVSENAISRINTKKKVITNWWQPNLKKIESGKKEFALAVGRLEKVKGFDLLISAWKNIKTNLVIIGSGQEKESLTKLIEKFNLSNKIKIIGEIESDELNNYYNKASVLIISSINEGGPRVALEALFLKIPVLSTNVGHMNQIFPDEFLAEKNNLASLTKLLEEYVDNIHLLKQDAIFKYIEDEFSVSEKAMQTVSVYEDVLQS